MFSTHDMSINNINAVEERGIAFVSASEVPSLPGEEYGASFVTSAYVEDAIARALPDDGLRRVTRLPRGTGLLPGSLGARKDSAQSKRVEI